MFQVLISAPTANRMKMALTTEDTPFRPLPLPLPAVTVLEDDERGEHRGQKDRDLQRSVGCSEPEQRHGAGNQQGKTTSGAIGAEAGRLSGRAGRARRVIKAASGNADRPEISQVGQRRWLSGEPTPSAMLASIGGAQPYPCAEYPSLLTDIKRMPMRTDGFSIVLKKICCKTRARGGAII